MVIHDDWMIWGTAIVRHPFPRLCVGKMEKLRGAIGHAEIWFSMARNGQKDGVLHPFEIFKMSFNMNYFWDSICKRLQKS